jgi:hypothetical protein
MPVKEASSEETPYGRYKQARQDSNLRAHRAGTPSAKARVGRA